MTGYLTFYLTFKDKVQSFPIASVDVYTRDRVARIILKFISWSLLQIAATKACLSKQNYLKGLFGTPLHLVNWVLPVLGEFHLCE